MSATADIAIVGGGLVGSALAFGLLRRGARVTLFDPQADDLHASAGNFGLVWLQGKGLGAPHYERLTRRAVTAWDGFAQALSEESGIATRYRQCGGVKIALSEAELDAQRETLRRLHNQEGADDIRILDRNELRELVPAAGPEAAGGTFCALDGHADPLATHTALRAAVAASPRASVRRGEVSSVRADGAGFRVEDEAGTVFAQKVVIAAGLGSTALGKMVGLQAPLHPQRGQILVTEKLPPFLDVACHTVRQSDRGTVLIGDSKEDVGHDRGTTRDVGAAMAARAARMFPALKAARIVRQWAALRVMSPDGLPIYAQSETHPGAMLLSCHSGVTLASAHAGEVAEAILDDALGARYPAFSPSRFAMAAA